MANLCVLKSSTLNLFQQHVRRISNFHRFAGQTAIVTASTKGIGLACARRLAAEGAKVVISSRSKQNVDEALKQVHKDGLTNISGIVCDAALPEHRTALVQHALTLNENSEIDIIVSNVANGSYRTLMQAKESSWDKIMNLNVRSHFQLVQECVPYMKSKKKGSIVFIGSLAVYVPIPEPGVYSVSKASMAQLTRLLAIELGDFNIRVNCIIPGLIDTEMAAPSLSNKELTIIAFEVYNLIRRAGQPEEVAGPVAFLCSEDASYITGETLTVSGYQTFTRV